MANQEGNGKGYMHKENIRYKKTSRKKGEVFYNEAFKNYCS
jgi:hypothetical protein